MVSSGWKTSLLDGRCFATASKDGTSGTTTPDETPNDTVWEIRDNNWGTQGIRYTSFLPYEYLIVLFILNFILVPNEIFVGICSFNLLISLVFILILFRNILDFSNLKFSHFSDPYFIIYYDENVIIRITSGTLGMYKDLFEKIEEKLKYQKQGV